MHGEIRWPLREAGLQRGDSRRVHICPASSADIPDERGSSPRRCRNTLVFLAVDRNRLAELEQAVREYLDWKSIETERETLNLDAFQANQPRTKREQADETIERRLPGTYPWLLVPGQADPQATLEWQETRLQGQEPIGVRVAKKLKNDGLLITQYAGTLYRRWFRRLHRGTVSNVGWDSPPLPLGEAPRITPLAGIEEGQSRAILRSTACGGPIDSVTPSAGGECSVR
jgi:hypothetical protein